MDKPCGLVTLVMAVAREDAVRRPGGHGDGGRREQPDGIYHTFIGVPPDRFPLLAAHAAQMVATDGDERFRFAIETLIDGLVTEAAHP
jgi:hypothetical protein